MINTIENKINHDTLKLKSPLIVQYEITPACNNNCGMCYNFWQYDPDSALSRKDVVDDKKVKEILEVLINHEVQAICYTGGEPFLAGETLFDLIKMAHDNKIYTSINSNGRLIDKKSAARLKTYGLNSALISLHGDSDRMHEEVVSSKGAFAQTLRGIENLIEAGINTTVNYVSTQKNVDRIVQTAEILKEMGVKSMTVTPLLPFPGVKDHENWAMSKEQFKQYFNSLMQAKEQGLKIDSTLPVAPCILKDMFPETYREYIEILSPRVCMAGVSFMVVSPEGFNRACIQAPELKEYGANINEEFDIAWKNAHTWSESNLIVDECKFDCYALSSCGGGCRTSSLAMRGDVKGNTMYMGEPINVSEAQDFFKKTEVKLDYDVTSFRKKEEVKIRKEDFGGVLANTSNQSFVFLDEEGVRKYEILPPEFTLGDDMNKGIRVLQAAGMIEPSNRKDLPIIYGLDPDVISASRFYERLAEKFPIDNKVRMLRADTGERIYF